MPRDGRSSYPPGSLAAVFTLMLDAPAEGSARLVLSGHLDDQAARQVLHAAADVAQSGCSRLLVDLDLLTSWDESASYAVVGCVRLRRWLADGVAVVAGTPVGRQLAESVGIAPDPGIMAPCPAS